MSVHPGDVLAARIQGLLEEALTQARTPFEPSENGERIELSHSELIEVVAALRTLGEREDAGFRARLIRTVIRVAREVNFLGEVLPQ